MPHPTRKAIARFAVTAVLIVVVVYPLSYGPLFYFHLAGSLSGPTFYGLRGTVYAPCGWLFDHNRPYSEYVYWWMNLGFEEYVR